MLGDIPFSVLFSHQRFYIKDSLIFFSLNALEEILDSFRFYFKIIAGIFRRNVKVLKKPEFELKITVLHLKNSTS